MSPPTNKPMSSSLTNRRPGGSAPKKPVGPPDCPAYLAIGTDVSAKFKGAFCEAKIHSFEKKLLNIRAQPLKDDSIPQDHVYTHEDVQGKLEIGSIVHVSYKNKFVEAKLTHIRDLSQYKIVFNDGDERIVKRNQMLLKGEKHYDSQSNLDNLPLLNPDAMKTSVIDEAFMGGSRSATRQLKAIMGVEKKNENKSDKLSAWSSLSDLSDSSDEDLQKIEDDGPSTSKKTKKSDLDQLSPKKRKSGRSASPKNEFNEGAAVILRQKALDTSKVTMSFGVVVSRSAYNSAVNDKNKQIGDNELPIRCLPKGDYRSFKPSQIAIYDENKVAPDTLNARLREACETLIRYKNKGRLPNGWTEESIHGTPQATSSPKKSRRKRHNPKNVPRREKFYRQLSTYYKTIIEFNDPKLNPKTKNGAELDMCRLFFTVRQEGGYRAVCYSDKWTKVAKQFKDVSADELREIYHNRLETFEYFHDKMADSKTSKVESDSIKTTPKSTLARQSHASTPSSIAADRGIRTTPKKSQTPAIGERKRKVQPSIVSKKQRRMSASSMSSSEDPNLLASRKGSSSSPHPSQKVRVMSPTELDATDGYVAADIFSQIVETKIIRAAHRTKFYSARVVDARRAPLEVILRVLTKLAPIVGASNNYKFQTKLHRDALIELGRLTAAFVHYCGWNNRFDEWVTIDRIKVSPETKRLSMLTLIRTYNFPSNLLDAIHSFFKRRRITREKYKARRRAMNADEAVEELEDPKKLTPGISGSKKKEFKQLDGPPAPTTLYAELQTFLYDNEGLTIPAALPEKIEKDEYDEIPNSELAAVNAMLSDAEPINDDSDDQLGNTPTTSKRVLKRKKVKPPKEDEIQKVAVKPSLDIKKEEELPKKKKKLTEEKAVLLTAPVVKKPIETPKPQVETPKLQSQVETQKQPQKQQKLIAKERDAIGKSSPNKKEVVIPVIEKPVTRSATPIKKQKVDHNINRPLDFMSSIATEEVKSGKSTPKPISSQQLKTQKSEEILPPLDIPISIVIPQQTTPILEFSPTQAPKSTSLSSPPLQPIRSRRTSVVVDKQAEDIQLPLTSLTSLTSPKTQEVIKEEEQPVNLDFKAFSPITPPPVTIQPLVIEEEVKALEKNEINEKNKAEQFSPRSRFLKTLAQLPQPAWHIPSQSDTSKDQESSKKLASQFEVNEDRNPISLETLRHIPPALLASHLNIPLSSMQQQPISTNSIRAFQTPPTLSVYRQNQLTTSAMTSQQTFSPLTSIATPKPMQPIPQIQQIPTRSNLLASQMNAQLNPQLLALLQTLQNQQNLQNQQALQQIAISQQQKPQYFSPNFQTQLPVSQAGPSTSIPQTLTKTPIPITSIQQNFNQTQVKQNVEFDQTPAMKYLTEYVLLMQYLSVDSTTQETLEALRRTFSMSRFDALRLIRPQFDGVVSRIAQLDGKCNEFLDPIMRPLVESFITTKISGISPSGLASMLQQFVHPIIYNQILSQPPPSQVAPLSLAQIQLILGQRQQQQIRQPIPTPTTSNFLNEQLLAQQLQQTPNTADQIHLRLQSLLMSMQGGMSVNGINVNGVPTSTIERTYISPPNDPRPSISAGGQPTPQTSTTTATPGQYSQCINHDSSVVYAPGIYSTQNQNTKCSSNLNVNVKEVQIEAKSVQMLSPESCEATINVQLTKQSQQVKSSIILPTSQTTKIVAAIQQKNCEDCGSNPVVEMHLLNKMPFHVRTEVLDSYAKAHKMSKERRNRPQCKVKHLTKGAQKQKIEGRRHEDRLEELRNGNGKDFMLLDERFSNTHAPTEPPSLYEMFSSIGYDIFTTDRLPESEEIKQKTENVVKEMSAEEVRENILKLMKEHNVEKTSINFDSLEDVTEYIHTLTDIAEQHQVRLGLANHNLEMTTEIGSAVIDAQKTIAEEQKKCEVHEEAMQSTASIINKNRPKYLLHRGRKGYY